MIKKVFTLANISALVVVLGFAITIGTYIYTEGAHHGELMQKLSTINLKFENVNEKITDIKTEMANTKKDFCDFKEEDNAFKQDINERIFGIVSNKSK